MISCTPPPPPHHWAFTDCDVFIVMNRLRPNTSTPYLDMSILAVDGPAAPAVIMMTRGGFWLQREWDT